MSNLQLLAIAVLLLAHSCSGFVHTPRVLSSVRPSARSIDSFPQAPAQGKVRSAGEGLMRQRNEPLHDLLGLGAPEIAIGLIAALVLFGPETLKSLSKDFGKAAAELKEIPKTFKEGMEEGQETAAVQKMKAIAKEKVRTHNTYTLYTQ
jgi:Sec-independent protein translocase protein TatA